MGKVVVFPKAPEPREREEAQATATGFYTPAEAARIARVPRHRLDAWRREGIIIPAISVVDFGGDEETGYTFQALVYLRVIRMLRDHVPLEKAVVAVQHLRDRFGAPGPNWADARILLSTGDVYAIRKDEWQVTVATRHGQKAAIELLFEEEFDQLRERADALLVPRRYQPFVEVDPSVRSGQPIVRETT